MVLSQRVLVSFDDICPYQCKHCFSLDIPRKDNNRSIEEIVASIATQEFDVVYISQRKENFINPNLGIELCESIFNHYNCNIFIITRTVMEDCHLQRLQKLMNRMKKAGKYLFIGVSVFAMQSYMRSENPSMVPSPYERMNFLKKMSCQGFYTITLIRPVFPREFVPVEELYEIVELCRENPNSCVVSGGLAVNENILWRLGLNASNLQYIDNVRYLEGAMEGELNFVDVSNELMLLKEFCIQRNVSFFEHTMTALNHLIEQTASGA